MADTIDDKADTVELKNGDDNWLNADKALRSNGAYGFSPKQVQFIWSGFFPSYVASMFHVESGWSNPNSRHENELKMNDYVHNQEKNGGHRDAAGAFPAFLICLKHNYSIEDGISDEKLAKILYNEAEEFPDGSVQKYLHFPYDAKFTKRRSYSMLKSTYQSEKQSVDEELFNDAA